MSPPEDQDLENGAKELYLNDFHDKHIQKMLKLSDQHIERVRLMSSSVEK